jgi:predicted outer membrane protein
MSNRGGASTDPAWIENEIVMLERTYNMYKVYAANAQTKVEKEAWKERLQGMEERISHARHKLEDARKKTYLKPLGIFNRA